MTKYILPIAAFALLISSCGTSNKYMADDIYVLKPSELAVGESSADETTYSAFKKRKQGDVADRQMYADQQSIIQYQQCLDMFSWRPNCGCTYTQWVNYSPYSYSRFNNRFGMSGIGLYAFNNGFGMSPHMYMYGTGQYGMYGHYGMYGNPYWNNNGFYGYGGMYNDYYGWGNMYGNGFGYGYGGYGYGGYGYGYGGNNGGQSTASNVFRGPRGSSTGFANPGGRNYSVTGTVKSAKAASPTNGTGTTKPTRPSTTSTTGKVVTRPIAEIGKSVPPRGTATSPYDRGVTKQPTNSGSRDYTRPTNVNRGVNTSGTSPARNTGTTTIRQTAPRGNTTVSPTRTAEPRTSSPTIERSSGNSSSGGSAGGSRSGGSTNSGSAGRRP